MVESTESLIAEIVECAKEVRSKLTPGFEEMVYKNAMCVELQERGLEYNRELPFTVTYKGHVVGSYRADLVVENRVIIELKAISNLTVINDVQLVNYLTATNIDDGLLINFGADKLEIRRKYRIYKKRTTDNNVTA